MNWVKSILFLTVVLLPLLVVGQDVAKIEQADYLKTISKFFEIEKSVIEQLFEKGVSEEEIPVFCYLSKNSQTTMDQIIEFRDQKQSWADISNTGNYSTDNYYFMIVGDLDSKTYIPIFNKFEAYNKMAESPAELSDEDIINIVNLRMIYRYFDYNPFEVIAMRDYGKTFIRINADVKKHKEKLIKEEKLKAKKLKEEAKEKSSEE